MIWSYGLSRICNQCKLNCFLFICFDLIFHICRWDHFFFLNCSPAAVSIQVCTAKMNLSDEVDLEDYVGRPDKISAADVSLLPVRGFSIIILNNSHLNYWDTVCIGSLVVCYLKKAPLLHVICCVG